ncbi:MAG: hypothetical protein NT154_31195 [Verrucomicrobia bacterium]|nr:hypothetical protein [Verrucomicrobiota bacterium]
MAVMRYKRFTKVSVLKGIGRQLLGRFFSQVNGQSNGKKLELPPDSADDGEYFQGVAKVLMSPEGLPDAVGEALYMVDEMSSDEGQERLHAVVQQAGLKLDGNGLSHAELALEVFLADPKLLSEAHAEQKLVRLAAFEYYGSKEPVDRTETFQPPTAVARAAMAKALDEWFAAHNRGRQTARVVAHVIDGAHYFIIRHGDTFIRTAKVNQQETEMLHYRPEKDDVVVYSPEFDEIRIHAGTKGEREEYRKQLGQRLFGDDDYFSQRKAYSLEPLRAEGADSLAVEGTDGNLQLAILREYEVAFDNGFEDVLIRRATDLFAAAAASPVKRPAVPASGRLVRAEFELHFTGQQKLRKVQIRTPNTLKLGRHCDARVVQRWLARRGFHVAASHEPNGAKDVAPVALS